MKAQWIILILQGVALAGILYFVTVLALGLRLAPQH